MEEIGWLRGPAVPPRAGRAHRGPAAWDPWLDTIHRLAQCRAADRARLARAGDTVRARLGKPRDAEAADGSARR